MIIDKSKTTLSTDDIIKKIRGVLLSHKARETLAKKLEAMVHVKP